MPSLVPFSWSTDLFRRGDDRDPFVAMQKEINRMFEDFGRGTLMRHTNGDTVPRLDVAETDTAIEVTAELPGLDEKDVEVVLHDDLLTIKGEKKSEREEKKKDYHLVERSFGSFARSIRLPFDAGADAVKANFAKGVLKVTINKPAEAKDRTVKIPVQRA